jgi:hypothetical protein
MNICKSPGKRGPLFFLDLLQNWNLLTNFSEPAISDFMKICCGVFNPLPPYTRTHRRFFLTCYVNASKTAV